VAPLVSLHHFDFLQPVFPTVRSRTQALRRLFAGPVALDPAAVAQQSVCYDAGKEWTVSVSWGFAVVVLRGVLSPREMETPMRTFLNWYRRADYTSYAFNTRPVARHPCHRPQVYYMRQARLDRRRRNRNATTVTEYERHRVRQRRAGGASRTPPRCWTASSCSRSPTPISGNGYVRASCTSQFWFSSQTYMAMWHLDLTSYYETVRAVPEEELLQGGVFADGGEGPEDDHRRRRLQRRRVRQGLGRSVSSSF
jgi:hypothetical protein